MTTSIQHIKNAEHIVKTAMQANPLTALENFEAELSASKLNTNKKLIEQRELHIFDKKLAYFFKDFNGAVYECKSSTGVYIVMGFAGKATKPKFHYSFKNEERKNEYIENWAARQLTAIHAKTERKETRKKLQENALELVNVGDVFRSSWGYEQTNIDYYQVIAIKGKSTVTLREIASKIVEETHYLAGKKVPCVNEFVNEAFDKRIAVYSTTDNKPNISVSLSSFQNAYLKHREADGSYAPDDFTAYY